MIGEGVGTEQINVFRFQRFLLSEFCISTFGGNMYSLAILQHLFLTNCWTYH